MSYRVDIPTLSANEVYTLTFEYEGTETIQLIVGDLTLETTDRRVVFTTTSPVNYIESNVNLINLNIYEGYYESDDFGGEYTQESYIEGKSLINLCEIKFIGDTSSWKYQMTGYDEEGYMHIIPRPSGYSNYYKVYPKTKPWNTKYGTYTLVIDFTSTLPNKTVDTCWESSSNVGNSQQKYKDFTYNGGQSRKYVVTFITSETQNYYMELNLGDLDLTTNTSGEIIVSYMVVEGDYFDEFCKEEKTKSWVGIGCVKSPKIVSHKAKNLVPTFKIISGYGSNVKIEVFDDNKHIEFAHTGNDARLQFQFDVASIGLTSGDLLGIEFDAMTKGVGTVANKTSAHLMFSNIRNIDDKKSISYFETGHYKNVVEIVGNSIQIHFRQNINGANGNEYFIVKNFSVFKINSVDDMKDDYEECIITTPDDLELYSFTDVGDNKTIVDTLDLTTGIVTKNVGILDITDINTLVYSGYDSTNDLYNVSCSFANFPNIVTKGNNTLVTSNILERKWYTLEGLYSHGMDGKFEIRISGTRGITSGDEAKQWVIDNLIMFYERTPEIIQLDINPLKSYRNGSITTSSQQLIPTLKTTLPISNKFTQTNLSSGQTYNIYFDGTATKLDAGGTIITNPVSPCEVECGGTTLTIEGTDIQNVRVLETTNKNEVSSVCGTTDVELSGVECVQGGIPNLLSTLSTDWENGTDYSVCIRYKYGIDVQPNEKYVFTVSNIGSLTYKEIAIWNTDKWVSNTESIITTQRLTPNTPYILTVPSGVTKVYIYFPYDSTGNLNQAHEYELRMQKGTVDLGYGGQKGATIPLVSKLEQPIKLRSLGTTYDSYNPVTGELIKRIGVSETDGSYSVLSSPVASQVMKIETLTNLFSTDFSLLVTNNYTKLNEDIITHTVETNSYNHLFFNYSKLKPNTVYTVILNVIENNLTFTTSSDEYIISSYVVNNYHLNEINNKEVGYKIGEIGIKTFVFITPDSTTLSSLTRNAFLITPYGKLTNQQTIKFKIGMVEGDYTYTDIPYFIDTETLTIPVYPHDTPQLYTNGQVKVYSESDVYPTTILNGQSTNNYEVNELNKSNNYTIRYDGTCESINLNGKSNEQGTNRIVKTSTNGSGNLTFVNDSGDIDNVLLVQNDVREQEINHFNGLETVEVSRMLIENQKNMWTNNPNNYVVSGWQATNTHYIPVKPGEVIYGTWQSNSYAGMTQYDENFNQLMGVNFFGPDSYGTGMSAPQQIDGYYRNQCTILENARYVRFTIPAWASSTIMFYRGSYQTELVTPTDKIYQGTFVDLPQPVQLNGLPDGTCDTYNPITGEYVQNVGYFVLDDTFASCWRIVKTKDGKPVAQRDLSTQEPNYSTLVRDYSFPGELYDYQAGTKAIANIPLTYNIDHTSSNIATPSLYGATYFGNHFIRIALPFTPNDLDQWSYSYTQVNNWLRENPIHIVYKRTEPITTQLTPIEIPTFEGGILQLMTTDGKVFPMIEYSMPTLNRYDTSSWETGAVYTQRNMTEAYFNESTTPMTPTETMTLTTDHISSGSIILNDNGNGLIVLKGNYTGRDIPYFTGMRSVEAIEVETTPSPDQPLFGKGGRK